MRIVIWSRLICDGKAADVHSHHMSWLNGQKVHDYEKNITNSDAVLAEHDALVEHCLSLPDYWNGLDWEGTK